MDATLKNKHYLVTIIEELLKVAKANHWGLCKKNDFIYLYNGAYWKLLSNDDLKYLLSKAALKMGVDKFEAKYYVFKEHLYKQFLSSAYLPEPEQPHDLILVNLKNGTFEITSKGGEIRDFNKKDFLTYQLPFEYDKKAKAPMFMKYLNRVLPDKGCQKILSEYLGYVFTRHLKLEKILLLYGSGANGKSVFFEIVNQLLGRDNTTNFSLQSLTNETGYQRAKIVNKLVNYTSEINGKLSSAIFKQLASGEPIEARLPYGEPFIIENYAKLVFNCNELPREVEQSNAYFRRFLIIPFSQTIPESEQDKELSKKIIDKELAGVFNWVLDGLNRLLKQKRFTKSEVVKNQVKQYRTESDSVQLFLDEENYIKSTTNHEMIKQVYGNYLSYSITNTYRPVSKIVFKRRLEAIGFLVKRKKNGNVVFLEKE